MGRCARGGLRVDSQRGGCHPLPDEAVAGHAERAVPPGRQGRARCPGKRGQFGASLGGGGAAIGAPGEDVGSIVDAGTVTWEMTSSMSQNTDGVPGAAERGDQFGAAVSSRTFTATTTRTSLT